MSRALKPNKSITKSSVDSPKEQLRTAWLYLGETLQKIIELQRSLARLSAQEQRTESVLLQKLRIYENAMPELVNAFERLSLPAMAKQAGGRPRKATEFNVAWEIAVAYYKKTGKDLSGEGLSSKASKKLMADYPEAYEKCKGWEEEGSEVPRPYPTRSASDCLFALKVSRPWEK